MKKDISNIPVTYDGLTKYHKYLKNHELGELEESMAALKNAIKVMPNGDIFIHGIGGFDGTNEKSAKSLQEIINNLVK